MRVVRLDPPRPQPTPDDVSRPFFEACAAGRLVLQYCDVCDSFQHYPRPACTTCGGPVEWRESRGEGIVYTFTVIRQFSAQPFRDLVPYVVAMVQLTEGPLLMANITDTDPEKVWVGMPVSAYAVRFNDSEAYPMFAPRHDSTEGER